MTADLSTERQTLDIAETGDVLDAAEVVQTDGLTKRFGDTIVVGDVDLRVPRGTTFGYLGPNGAGKTTLIRMLLGLVRPTRGRAKLLGLPVPAERRQALARVGAIVDEPRLNGHMTGRQNLWALAAAREPEAHARIDAALERVGLRDRADDPVSKYSMGMRQRLGIAACLIADPELLILDEPMNGLDPAGMLEFRELIRSPRDAPSCSPPTCSTRSRRRAMRSRSSTAARLSRMAGSMS
jgi:ABC-2 type transport system ATP-binding protein